MRLRRRASPVSSNRRQRQPSDLPRGSQGFAYRSSRSDLEGNTGRQTARKPSDDSAAKGVGVFLMRRFGLVLLFIALIVSLINVLSLSSDARIVTLSSADSTPFLHDTSAYQSAADKLLAGSVWNRNKLTVNTEAVSQQMLKQFPELSDVSVTLPLLSKRPTVYVQTAQPVLILVAGNGSFVIDESGKALLNAANLPQGNLKKSLPVVTDQSGLDARLNKQAMTSGDVSFIQTVAAELAAKHVGIASMVLPAASRELDVHLAGQPYFVKFNLENDDARQQAGTFLATQAELKREHTTPSQYVDVRVDGRAYYR